VISLRNYETKEQRNLTKARISKLTIYFAITGSRAAVSFSPRPISNTNVHNCTQMYTIVVPKENKPWYFVFSLFHLLVCVLSSFQQYSYFLFLLPY
jgi:hypothetical protein